MGRLRRSCCLNFVNVTRSRESGGPLKLRINETAALQKLKRAAAVEDEDMAGYEFCVDEEGYGVGDVIGSAGAMQRGAADEVGFPFAGIAGHGYCAGSNGVNADFGRERFGETFRQHDHAGFGRAVRNVAGPREDAADVRKIYDDSVRLLQERRGCLRAKEGRFQIGIQRGIPRFLRRVCEVRGKKIGGAVDENIEAAELFRGLLKQVLNVDEAAKIGLQGDAFSPEPCNFGSRIDRFGLRPVVMDYDIGAFAGQAHGYGATDAFGRSCDQRDAAI